jgi:PadR family transcriptional regulator, regulatory protein PadR
MPSRTSSEGISRELVAASASGIVLALLSRGEDYGYAMIRRVREASGDRLQWAEGMLYPVLHRLEADGLIRSRWGASPDGRKRKYYEITAQGAKALRRHRQDWLAVHDTLVTLWNRSHV